jgi:hypothetical protein
MNILKEFTARLTKIVIAVYILNSPSAFAKFLLEPQWRVYSGDYKGGGTNGSLRGESSNLHVGYIGESFMAGLSFERGWLNFEEDITGTGASTFKYGGVGTFLGFHFLNRFKIYTGYTNTSLEPRNNDSFRYFGQQVNFGLGYRFWDILILNYEYMNNFYTQIEDDETGKTSSLDSNIRSDKHSYGISMILIF